MAISKRKRFIIFRRDKYTCRYCGRTSPAVTLEVDHKIPRSQGGTDDEDNLVTACFDCNRGKGNLDAHRDLETDYHDWLEECYEAMNTGRPDTLPAWFVGQRGSSRPHVKLNFDFYAVADELPTAQDKRLSLLHVLAKAEAFDTVEPF